jgi:CRISPR-associated endonuclease Cas1
MQSHVSATFAEHDCTGGVCVVDGYGVSVRIARKQLVVSDGIGRFRRERRFSKAFADIGRLVVIGHEGAITLEALRWINDAGIAFLQIDRDGRIISASAQFGLNDPRLRRALALAPTNPVGLEIARYVLCAKLNGQKSNLARNEFAGNDAREIAAALETARNAVALPELLYAESSGAATYWGAWQDIQLQFARKDEKRVSEHWKSFGQRHSPITGSPRLSVDPANAMLNYLYALLETETRFACLACGLDPGMGIFHLDTRARDSLALDLMEAVRPSVDAFLLDLISGHCFRAADFVETRKGVCRVLAPLTHELATSIPNWRAAIAPVVEEVARMLAAVSATAVKVPTYLTQANRREAQGSSWTKAQGSRRAAKVRRTCPGCGVRLPQGRLYCDDCLPEERQEHLDGLMKAGPDTLAQLRAEGSDPTQTPAAKRKLGRANARRVREAARWDRDNERPDPHVFTREILPLLQHVTLRKMMQATGLSLRYCSRIRRGYVPHARHWQALKVLGKAAI